MSKPDFSALTQRECAAMHGVDERTIRRWSDEGEDSLPRNDDGTYNAPLTIAWRMQKESGSALDLNAERARLAKEQADKTAMANAVERGELLSVSTVATEWGRLASSIRAKFLGLPTKLAPRLAGLKNALTVRDALTAEINQVLVALRDYRPGDGGADDSEADRANGSDLSAAAELDGQPVGRRAKISKSRK